MLESRLLVGKVSLALDVAFIFDKNLGRLNYLVATFRLNLLDTRTQFWKLFRKYFEVQLRAAQKFDKANRCSQSRCSDFLQEAVQFVRNLNEKIGAPVNQLIPLLAFAAISS